MGGPHPRNGRSISSALPNESTAGKQIVERDGERARARQNRLGEARPTVPGALSWLMLVAVLMVLAVLSVASRSAVGPIIQAALVLGTAVAFASTLLLISDLDHPYAGALHRDPTQTEFVLDQITAEVRSPLPCDQLWAPDRRRRLSPSHCSTRLIRV